MFQKVGLRCFRNFETASLAARGVESIGVIKSGLDKVVVLPSVQTSSPVRVVIVGGLTDAAVFGLGYWPFG